ncbi:hypothetical protein M885DRAFT_140651 [Pelagophyceae sp. CCMP2097]|nr:hypothetical protein M885DRAFT_140651 [Pelagophyceae sp. CCMP2097]
MDPRSSIKPDEAACSPGPEASSCGASEACRGPRQLGPWKAPLLCLCAGPSPEPTISALCRLGPVDSTVKKGPGAPDDASCGPRHRAPGIGSNSREGPQRTNHQPPKGPRKKRGPRPVPRTAEGPFSGPWPFSGPSPNGEAYGSSYKGLSLNTVPVSRLSMHRSA